MHIIFSDNGYDMVIHKENDAKAPYAIFKDGKQVSQWYCTMGWASIKLRKLINRDLLKLQRCCGQQINRRKRQ